MILMWLACIGEPQIQSVSDKARIMNQVEENPLLTVELCNQIKEEDQREFCFLFGIQGLPPDQIDVNREVCNLLEGNTQFECWFQVAELSKDVSDCVLAGPFEPECRLHLCLKDMINRQVSEWDEIVATSKRWGVPLEQGPIWTMMLSHYFRGGKPLDLQLCETVTNPTQCRRSIGSIYAKRLKEWFDSPEMSCDTIPQSLQHSEEPLLKRPFETLKKNQCL